MTQQLVIRIKETKFETFKIDEHMAADILYQEYVNKIHHPLLYIDYRKRDFVPETLYMNMHGPHIPCEWIIRQKTVTTRRATKDELKAFYALEYDKAVGNTSSSYEIGVLEGKEVILEVVDE